MKSCDFQPVQERFRAAYEVMHIHNLLARRQYLYFIGLLYHYIDLNVILWRISYFRSLGGSTRYSEYLSAHEEVKPDVYSHDRNRNEILHEMQSDLFYSSAEN